MSQVIIGDILPYTQASAIQGQTVFGTNWTANAASDVVVFYTPLGDAPDDLTQQLDSTQFSVDFIGSQQDVQVTLVTPAVNTGDIVTITRMTPADRENLYTNTNFTPSMLNNDFGILTLVDQQAQLVNQGIAPRYNYSAQINNNSMYPTRDTILPLLGPNQVWLMNSSQTAIEAFTIEANAGSVNPGLANQLGYYATDGNVISGLATANNGVLITSALGVPSISNTLPTTVQSNITQLGIQTQALNMGGFQINNLATPSLGTDAANKSYVDTIATGGGEPVYAATTANLNVTQAGAGVGATLTNAGSQAVFTLDGQTPPLNSRILVKNQSTNTQNGVYTLTNVGSVSTNWVLTRAIDYDTPANINDTGIIPVINGTANANTGWYNTTFMVTVDTTPVTFVQFGNQGTVTSVGSGTGLTGGPITSTGTLSFASIAAHSLWANVTGSSAVPTVINTSTFLQVVNIQKFSNSGNYTPTIGIKYARFTVIGGGGGGGGSGAGAGALSVGGGGGAGGFSQLLATAAQIGSSATITIGSGGTAGANTGGTGGTGGNTTVALAGTGTITITANGGSGGVGNTTDGVAAGGAGGTASNGDTNITGQSGGYAMGSFAAGGMSGAGGTPAGGLGMGGPIISVYTAASRAGNAGVGFGGGGGGAASNGSGALGGVGAGGYVLVEEFIAV